MKKHNVSNEMYLISILADLNNETLFIPKIVKNNSRNLASQEAALYFEYKNRYPCQRWVNPNAERNRRAYSHHNKYIMRWVYRRPPFRLKKGGRFFYLFNSSSISASKTLGRMFNASAILKKVSSVGFRSPRSIALK